MTIDIQLWLWYLHHGQRKVADAMRRAHNRSIITMAIHPATRIQGWNNLTFEQEGIDTKAVRIHGEPVR